MLLEETARQATTSDNQSPILPENLTTSDFVIVGLLVALILISIVGNCLVCVAIFTDRRLRKLGNAFIVSLAIADLFVSCLVMTFALCNDLMQYWIFGEWFCDIWISFDIMCSTASILNLCAISLDRFVHIKDCLLYNQLMTRRIALSAVMVIWFISALVSFVPINLGWHKPDHQWLSPPTVAQANSGRTAAKLDYVAPDLRLPRERGDNAGASQRQLSAARRRRTNYDGSSGKQSKSEKRGAQGAGVQFNQVEFNPQDGSSFIPEAKPNLSDRPLAGSAHGFARSLSQHQSQPALLSAGNHSSGNNPSQHQQLPTCALSLTPTYAIISSTISFYIPCIIMLGLYTKLFACARRHVREIRAISKAPAPLTIPTSRSMVQLSSAQSQLANNPTVLTPTSRPRPIACAALGRQVSSDQLTGPALAGIGGPIKSAFQAGTPVRTWLKFSKSVRGRGAPRCEGGAANAQSSSITATQIISATNNEGQDKPINRDLAASEARKRPAPDQSSRDVEEQRPFITEASKVNNNNNNNSTNKPTSTKINFAPLPKASPNSQQQQQQVAANQVATHKAAVTLGIIMGTFLFCWVPFFCLNIIKALCVDCISGSLFRAFTWLGYANSALNPIIYGIHNSEFRQAFNRIFFKHLNIKNSRYYLSQPVRRFSRTPIQQQQRNNSLSRTPPKSHDDSNT